MIISGGENIYPSEIENLLGSHPTVKDVAAIARPHALWGEAVHAVIVLRDGATTSEADILAWCDGRIAGFKRPKSVSLSGMTRCAYRDGQDFASRASRSPMTRSRRGRGR